MQYYKIVNNQPIAEDQNYFWKYGDAASRLSFRPTEHTHESPDASTKSKPRQPNSGKGNTGRSASPISNKKRVQSTKDRQAEDELSECTFKPQLIADNARFWVGDTEFLRRCELWQEQRQHKLVKQRQQETQQTLKECTFQPKISDMSKNIIFAIGQEENTRFEKLSHHKKTYSQYQQYLQDIQKTSYQNQRQQEQGVLNQYHINDKVRYEEAVAKLHKELHKIEINLNQ